MDLLILHKKLNSPLPSEGNVHLRSQTGNGPLNQSQESGVACPRQLKRPSVVTATATAQVRSEGQSVAGAGFALARRASSTGSKDKFLRMRRSSVTWRLMVPPPQQRRVFFKLVRRNAVTNSAGILLSLWPIRPTHGLLISTEI
jgi:hypothetical protein